MNEDNYIFKTKPNFIFIGFAIISAIGYAFIAHLAWPSKTNVHNTDYVLALITPAIFILLSVASTFCVLRLEICYLRPHELIISRPLLFIRRAVLLSDIERITEKENKINISRNAFRSNLITVGNTSTIWLRNGKKERISNMEVWGYGNLIKKIKSGRSIKTG